MSVNLIACIAAGLGLILGAVFASLWLRGRLAAAQARAEAAEARAAQREAELASARESLSLARSEAAAAQARLEAETRGFAERLKLLDESRATMSAQFRELSQQIFDEKSRSFAESNRQQIDQLLRPLREKLQGFEQQVKESYDKDTRDRVALFQQIRALQESSRQVGEDARNLALALRGDTRQQGAWGEMILERIFELSGLTRGREYETQFSVSTADGRKRPDAIVRMPDGRVVVIDSKVSLTAYARATETVDEDARRAALAEHVQSLRNHIRGLSAKDYQHLDGIDSLDFILMFVPSEAAYIEAIRAAPALYDEALSANVALVSPSTLLPTLRTVENLWRIERQSQNAQAIADEAGKLYDQFVLFDEALAEVGQRLEQAGKAYELARKRLIDGRGNLVGKAEKLRRMGAKTSKRLPEALRAAAADEDGAGDEDAAALPVAD